MEFVAAAWKSVKTSTIANCFRKAGFGATETDEEQEEEDADNSEEDGDNSEDDS